ncbi:hypothetical protein BOTBODRAFT_168898 [Botryobasidium botryosum FD-172 SS1]|uniref:Peptidase C14 caspase domain-containing protein n=1 Tax=Botryobasidium botryosum (strain FD-172 SS1) TaxID=930990 RepID=A0A067N1D2_BOTB1|nr:hypothetical protein BOTBODRAFT_168898 [Botryobasidium botryosum FD-172 SS1]
MPPFSLNPLSLIPVRQASLLPAATPTSKRPSRRTNSLPLPPPSIERLAKVVERESHSSAVEGEHIPRRRALIVRFNFSFISSGPLLTYTLRPFLMKIAVNDTTKSEDTGRFTHADAANIRELLIRHGYKAENIRTLLNAEDRGPERQPTRANVVEGLKWLVDGAVLGDRLFVYFSGHGARINGDEVEGMNTAILLRGDEANDPMTKDEFYELVLRDLPFGSSLTAVFDSCYSGTMIALPICLTGHSSIPADPQTPLNPEKDYIAENGQPICAQTIIRPHGKSLGNTKAITACSAGEEAYGVAKGGWFTRSFLRAMSINKRPTLGELYYHISKQMNIYIKNENELRLAADDNEPLISQTVQICSSHPIGPDTIFEL